MLVLGLILIILALIIVAYMWYGTADLAPLPVDLGAFAVTLSPLEIFLVGAGSILLLSLGSALLSAGIQRQRRKRQEVKRLRKQVERQREAPRPAERQREAPRPAKSQPGVIRQDPGGRDERPVRAQEDQPKQQQPRPGGSSSTGQTG